MSKHEQLMFRMKKSKKFRIFDSKHLNPHFGAPKKFFSTPCGSQTNLGALLTIHWKIKGSLKV